MIPMDVFVLILAIGGTTAFLVTGRHDPCKVNITPTQWCQQIRASRTTWWQYVAAGLAITAKFTACLAAGLVLALILCLGEGAKALAYAFVGICIAASFVLWQARRILADITPPVPSGLTELIPVPQGDPS
ncbi:hypothetical protein [Streptosporangium sp. NPDC048865]|uniref:hypothetical protein n=1 Tax=Streptosporangium sp. NPDC048865 TaxID=3155766 RepID=UPI00341FAC04